MFVGIAAFAEELSPLREYEPIVVRGAALTDWLNSDSSPSTRITTPPQKPGAIVISPLPGGAKVEWGVRPEQDVYGFNIYLSTSPGGPYTKLTAQARGAYEPREYSVSVVQPGTYYIVMTTLDYSGNESAYSEEASFTWSP